MTSPDMQESESVYTSTCFNKNRFQALSSPPSSEINAPDDYQNIPPIVCSNCIKPHKRRVTTWTASRVDGTKREVKYWEDMDACDPYLDKCICQFHCDHVRLYL